MRQKYIILKEKDTHKLKIQEYELIEKENFSMACEVEYDQNDVLTSISEDKRKLISLLRSQNFFPVERYIDKIAESIIELYRDEACDSKELILEDKDYIEKIKPGKPVEIIPEEEEPEEELDIEDMLSDEEENEDLE